MRSTFLNTFRGLPLPFLLFGMMQSCGGEHLAGTSVSTDNPGLVVGFTRDQKPAIVTGTANIYLSEFDPLVDSVPFASFNINEQDSIAVSMDSLYALWVRTVPKGVDSLLRLNLLIKTPEGEGSFVGDLSFVRRGDSLVNLQGEAKISATLNPLLQYAGTLSIEERRGVSDYVVLFGTPFFALVDKGAFTLKDLPQGKYDLHWVPFDRNVPVSGSTVDVPVYGIRDPLTTDSSGTFSPSGIEDTLRLPAMGPRKLP
jgi:hypothetical protein